MFKFKKVALLVLSLLLVAALATGCASKEEAKTDTSSHDQHQQQGSMQAGDMMNMMNKNPDMMLQAMSSSETRQSMTKIMSSPQMTPVMTDMMKNTDMQKTMVTVMATPETREAMVKVMSDPAMLQPMMEIMADPKMKDTFTAMMKDPKLMPMAKEAMGMK